MVCGVVKRGEAATFRAMSTINATIDVGDDSAGVIAGLLRSFPKGRRVRVALTDEPAAPEPVPTLDAFLARIEAARRLAPPCPWETTEEALKNLREGERE